MSSNQDQASDKSLSSGISKLGVHTLQYLSDLDNLVFSPLSIYIALSMVYAGSGGDTQAELEKIFHPFRLTDLMPDIQSLLEELSLRIENGVGIFPDSIKGGNRPLTIPEEYQSQEVFSAVARPPAAAERSLWLEFAQSLWIQSGYTCRDAYLDLLRSKLNAEISSADLVGDPVICAREINHWIKEKTRGLISEVVSPASFSELTRLVLINTVYFKGKWKFQFRDPVSGTFHLLDGTKKRVPMVSASIPIRYFRRYRNYDVLDIPYQDRTISLIIFLPRKRGIRHFRRLESKLPALLEDLPLKGHSHGEEIRIIIPEFGISSPFNIRGPLKALGIERMFLPDANLSGLSAEKPLWIDEMIHASRIVVDQYGTEAAAVTYSVAMGHIPREDMKLVVDHPFIFLIYDKSTRTVLFLGRVIDPVSGEYLDRRRNP